MKNKPFFSIDDIVKFAEEVDIKIVNYDPMYSFDSLGTTLPGSEKTLVFVSTDRKDKAELITKTLSNIIICDHNVDESLISNSKKCLIKVGDPKLFFSIVGNALFVRNPDGFIHPTSSIDQDADIHPTAYIGPNCSLGKVKVGANSVIYGNVFIYDNTVIGSNVTINAGTVIGAEGFGYNRNKSNEAIQFPHIGGVIIEDNVDIGSNTSIDRGSLSNTIIKKGAKIDNLVHIAHNVVVGENTMVIANAMVGGSTTIGENSWIAPSSSLRDAIAIGNNVTVGMGSVVTKSISDDQVQTGNPARELKDFVKLNNKLKSLINE
ncbi:MAG: UDP-3-O-(3-hydroxymyristoyl)glucosamine N-acyltransferase [Bacteroidota bacterium]